MIVQQRKNSSYLILRHSLYNDFITLKKVEKWTKNILNRIDKRATQLESYFPTYFECKEKHTVKNFFKPKQNDLPKNSTKMVMNMFKNQSQDDKTTNKEKYSIKCLEELYERKYERKYYDVLLFGNGLDQYSTIYERIDEINRCTGVKSPEMVRPIVDKFSKITKLKIRVKKYDDYQALLSIWPIDSFKTGVTTQSALTNLKVLIMNVERKIKIGKDETEVKELCSKYGLNHVKRIYNHNNKPCKTLVARCEKISDYIQLLKHGVMIGKSQKKYVVLPYIVNYKVCANCGSLNHYKKDCHVEQRCLKCSEHGHRIEECKSNHNKCLNCSGLHKCFNDSCEKFSQKKIHINRFILKILIGENFISDQNDILFQGTKYQNEESNLLKDNRENQLNSLKNSILNKKFDSNNLKLRQLEQTINSQSASICETKENLESIQSSIRTVKESVETLNDGFKSQGLGSMNVKLLQQQIENNFFRSQKQIYNILGYFKPD